MFSFITAAYVVRGKVMFWHESVCLSTLAGGLPIPGLAEGVPRVPPDQVWMGYPPRPGTGYPHGPGMGSPRTWNRVPSQTWDGVPSQPGTRYPLRPGMGYPSRPGIGYPPDLRWGTPPFSEHLLRGGRYASCVHAGGLSCLILTIEWVVMRDFVSSTDCNYWGKKQLYLKTTHL